MNTSNAGLTRVMRAVEVNRSIVLLATLFQCARALFGFGIKFYVKATCAYCRKNILFLYIGVKFFLSASVCLLLQLFLDCFFECWENLVEVADNSIVCHFKNRCLFILVDCNYHFGIADSSHMLYNP